MKKVVAMDSSISKDNGGFTGHMVWCRTGPKQTCQEDKGSYVFVKGKPQTLK